MNMKTDGERRFDEDKFFLKVLDVQVRKRIPGTKMVSVLKSNKSLYKYEAIIAIEESGATFRIAVPFRDESILEGANEEAEYAKSAKINLGIPQLRPNEIIQNQEGAKQIILKAREERGNIEGVWLEELAKGSWQELMKKHKGDVKTSLNEIEEGGASKMIQRQFDKALLKASKAREESLNQGRRCTTSEKTK